MVAVGVVAAVVAAVLAAQEVVLTVALHLPSASTGPMVTQITVLAVFFPVSGQLPGPAIVETLAALIGFRVWGLGCKD